MVIAMPTMTFAQTDTIAKFGIFKNEKDANDFITQLQQEARPGAIEGAYYTETRKGELIPVPDGKTPEEVGAKFYFMNWGDLPAVDDTNSTNNRFRGYCDLDHPLVWPINGGKDGYQVEMMVIRQGASEKDGVKPIYGFLDLKKTLANTLKDGTTHQVLVSVADSAKGKGKKVYNNITAYYYSANEKNFALDNSSNKILIDYKKMVDVRIHWVKIRRNGMLRDAKPDERGAKCIVSAWGRNTMLNPDNGSPLAKPDYRLPTANK